MSCTRAFGTGLPRGSVTWPRMMTACAGVVSRTIAAMERSKRVASGVREDVPCACGRRSKRFIVDSSASPSEAWQWQRVRTGLLTGAISRPNALAAPSRCDEHQWRLPERPHPWGARFTVAGQWRSFTALPEHSRAVAVVGQASPAKERCRKGETSVYTALCENSAHEPDLLSETDWAEALLRL